MDNPLRKSLDKLMIAVEANIKNCQNVESENELSSFLMTYFEFKTLYGELDAIRKKMYHHLDTLDKVAVPKMMQAQGVDKVAVPEIERSFYILSKHSASILDKVAGFDWLRNNELGEIITETVNAGTLAKVIKEYVLETGKEPPSEIFKFTEYSSTGMSKYKPK